MTSPPADEKVPLSVCATAVERSAVNLNALIENLTRLNTTGRRITTAEQFFVYRSHLQQLRGASRVLRMCQRHPALVRAMIEADGSQQ